ncbi:tRNA (N(6)-L-threonylcarbamoyladenosine(37)-C(2))-methylthiotransferase MtaB [Chlamydiota bacterium]
MVMPKNGRSVGGRCLTMMKKVYIKTLGCKVNQYDGQWLSEKLVHNNCEIVSEKRSADICIINTCTVTEKSDKKARNIISQCVRENPDAMLFVTGCLASKNSESIKNLSGVDFIISNNEKTSIIDLIKNIQKKDTLNNKIYDSSLENKNISHFINHQKISSFYGHDRSFVKIQDGCSNFCSYCVVPYVRGESASKKPENVIKEVEGLLNNGCMEIVLTGINLGLYGRDLDIKKALEMVLKEIVKFPKLKRIRLSSIEVDLVSDELVKLMNCEKKLCNHLHIPLQSGSNKILKKMRRPYTKEFYFNKIEDIKKTIDNVLISTDVISGFPGEKIGDHLQTIRMIDRIGFSKVHIFPFSFREGVYALNYIDEKTSQDKIKKRKKELEKAALAVSERIKNKYLGSEVEVLFESKREKETGLFQGLTENYLRVLFSGNDKLMGRLVNVRIKEIKKGYLLGEKIK